MPQWVRGAPGGRQNPPDNDGAGSRENTRRRIQFIADQWQLPASDVAKAMTLHTDNIIAFVKKHGINCDWLLCGDLKGFLLMNPYRGVMTRAPTARQLSDEIRSFPPELEKIIAEKVDRMLAERGIGEPEPA